MSSASVAAGVLRQAAKRIEDHGWYQGGYFDLEAYDAKVNADRTAWERKRATFFADCAVCAAGAINVVDKQIPDHESTVNDLFCDYLVQHRGAVVSEDGRGEIDVIDTIGGWNDDAARTKEQVINALLTCAERLEVGK